MIPPKTLALLFCIYAAFTVPMVAVLMPPFQAADELAHAERAEQIGSGTLLAKRSADGMSAGGLGYEGLRRLWWAFDPLRFHPNVKVNAKMEASETTGWGALGWRDFPNTAIYPPFLYLPASFGLTIGRLSHMSVWHAVILGRLMGGLAAVLIATAAIALADAAAPLLFALLCLPMSLGLFGAISQDGPMIACAALGSVLLARIECLNRRFWLGCVLLALVSAARPAYLPLCVAPLLVPGRTWPFRLAGAAVVFIITIGWSMLMGKVAMPLLASQHITLQIAAIRHDPRLLLPLIYATLHKQVSEGLPLGREFIGVLGWLDTTLPNPYYALTGGILLLAFMLSRWPAPYSSSSSMRASATALMLIATVCVIYILQYLSWSDIGGRTIEGVQGRYFLPLAPFLLFALPVRQWNAPKLVQAGFCAFPILSIVLTGRAILIRYYAG